MQTEAETRLQGSLRIFSRALAAGVILIGLLVLAGWLLDVPTLQGGLPNLVSMKPNAALGFVLAGGAVGLLAAGVGEPVRLRAIRLLAALVAVIGLLTLLEYLLGWNLGIDQLLFHDLETLRFPGRAAPNTALSFVLLGAGIWLLTGEEPRSHAVAQSLTLAAGLIAFLALVGYAYGNQELYGIGAYTQMALLTAVALAILSLGLLLARPDRGLMDVVSSDTAGGIMVRRLLPAVVAIPALLGWLTLIGEDAGLYHPHIGMSMLVVVSVVVFGTLVSANAWLLHRVDVRRRHAEVMVSRLAAIVASSEDAIIGKTLEGIITSWNPGAQKLYGYPAEETVGKPVSILVPPERADELPGIIERIRKGEQISHFETVRITKDGRRLDMSVTVSPIKDDRGRIVGASTIARDVTARKKAEETLARQTRELADTVAELQQFAYVASHDLQEPLRMVASYVQLLARRYRGKLDADADEFIGYAVDGAKRMQQLINDLLSYSRVGTHGKPFEPIDCEKVLGDTLSNLQVAMEESGARVTHDPLPTVMADPIQMGQLFQNLVGNAVKFRGQEPPRVHLSAEDRGGEWLFSIRDNGIGIDPQFSDRVFLIFQRLHGREEYPGTGIGLAVCKKIVERHGGRIWVESEPGKGSIFYFTIPKRRAKT